MNGGILRRAERSLLAGAVAGVMAMIYAISQHHTAAKAAAQHTSQTAVLFHGFLAVGAVVAIIVFVVASLVARSNRPGGGNGTGRNAGGRRLRREDW